MEMRCPQCMAPLETTDGQTARCKYHPEQFRILYSRLIQPAPVERAVVAEPRIPIPPPQIERPIIEQPRIPIPPPQVERRIIQDAAPPMAPAADAPRIAQAMCRNHPNVRAQSFCTQCGAPLCATCSFESPQKQKLCLDCVQKGNRPVSIASLGRAVTSSRPGAGYRAGPAVAAMCATHPTVAAVRYCNVCSKPMCATCDREFPGNIHLCPTCAGQPGRIGSPQFDRAMTSSPTMAASIARPPVTGAPPPQPLFGATYAPQPALAAMCATHPSVAAVRRCSVCSKPMCATCDFEFPGNIHMCPECATRPRKGGSLGKRRGNVIASGVLAVISTICIAAMMSFYEEGLSEVLSMAIFIMIIVGVALSLGSIDRRLHNPAIVWVFAVWNGILLALMILLSIIGLMAMG